MPRSRAIQLFTTCPPSYGCVDGSAYRATARDVARWSDRHGVQGILVYTDNGLVDPWLMAQDILGCTERLEPLVAVQPIYMHPYAAAKMVSTLTLLHGRRIWLNMLAGGFKNDLLALGDDTPHDDRYVRTTEYTLIMKGLWAGKAVSFAGKYYRTDKLKLTPTIEPGLTPGILISGSSAAGIEAARAIEATIVQYPKPPEEYAEEALPGLPCGFRVGILARGAADEAWRIAEERFPLDRKGQITHQLAMKVSDSAWHQQLSDLGKAAAQGRSPYWLHPFENYKTFCPYLVGDHATVAAELAGYFRRGFKTLIVDVPRDEADLVHAQKAIQMAEAMARA
ncbi:MAG: LLM class flavin-dependent oxidoreductase [Planctomycetes bacterium]|nr:LLM class flavin-dependent oxidoreductase [Planctomycetota bacterium]